MKKILKTLTTICLVITLCFTLASCDNNKSRGGDSGAPEHVELTKSMLGEVEFENSDTVNINQEGNEVTISGKIDAMSKSQKNTFGVDEVTHVVVLKFTFDKERTISSFKIKGNVTKVYADSRDVENYAGTLTDLLDNESGEDAYCELILSANTESYRLVSTYSDGTESTISVKITATLATATTE